MGGARRRRLSSPPRAGSFTLGLQTAALRGLVLTLTGTNDTDGYKSIASDESYVLNVASPLATITAKSVYVLAFPPLPPSPTSLRSASSHFEGDRMW